MGERGRTRIPLGAGTVPVVPGGRVCLGVPGEAAAPRRSHAAGGGRALPSPALLCLQDVLTPLCVPLVPAPAIRATFGREHPRAAEIRDFGGRGAVFGVPLWQRFGAGWCKAGVGVSWVGAARAGSAPLQVFRAARGTVYSWCLARIFNFQECKAAGEQQGVCVPTSLCHPGGMKPKVAAGRTLQQVFVLWLGAAGT